MRDECGWSRVGRGSRGQEVKGEGQVTLVLVGPPATWAVLWVKWGHGGF